MGKKKKTTKQAPQGRQQGPLQQQRSGDDLEAAVDALAEALGGAFPLGAVRGVLQQCGGDAGRCVRRSIGYTAAVRAPIDRSVDRLKQRFKPLCLSKNTKITEP